MRLHPREIHTQQAAGRFRMGFSNLISGETEFSVELEAISALISCVALSMKEDTPSVKWPKKEGSPKFAFEAGQLMESIATEIGLTHGEMLSALNDVLSSTTRHLIQAERHPENPDSPGGLEAQSKPERPAPG